MSLFIDILKIIIELSIWCAISWGMFFYGCSALVRGKTIMGSQVMLAGAVFILMLVAEFAKVFPDANALASDFVFMGVKG